MPFIPADYPVTPRATARAVLKAIEARPELFNMDLWAALPENAELFPPRPEEDATVCGTVMCAAGWTAHLTGWTLYSREEAVYATKVINGEPVYRTVPEVAERELGLSLEQAFWLEDEEAALRRLREIAGLPAND